MAKRTRRKGAKGAKGLRAELTELIGTLAQKKSKAQENITVYHENLRSVNRVTELAHSTLAHSLMTFTRIVPLFGTYCIVMVYDPRIAVYFFVVSNGCAMVGFCPLRVAG